MDEDQFKLEARLAAIEYMVMNMYSVIHRTAQSPSAVVIKSHDDGMTMLDQTTLPGVDPAYADAFAAEIQIAVQRMQDGIEEMLGLPRRQRP